MMVRCQHHQRSDIHCLAFYTVLVVACFGIPRSVWAESPEETATETNVASRGEHLLALGKLYGELRGLNEVLLTQMKSVADVKDVDGVRAVFKRKDEEYETRFEELMRRALAVPDSALARDAALLTLNTTYDDERDVAIDLLLEHHVDSPRIHEAIIALGYTSRDVEICQKILEKNTNPAVVAHARFQLANRTWRRSDKDRTRAKQTLWELVKTSQNIDFHESGRWGPNQKKRNLSQIASRVLQRINANETVKVGHLLPEFQGIDLKGDPIALSDYRGKVTLIVFWATWCSPCLKMTELERRLAKRYEKYPFELLGVCGDDEIDENVNKVVANHNITWRSVRDILPEGGRLSAKFGTPSWPFCIVIDRDGTVRHTSFPTGVTNNPDTQQEYFQNEIEKLLVEYNSSGQ